MVWGKMNWSLRTITIWISIVNSFYVFGMRKWNRSWHLWYLSYNIGFEEFLFLNNDVGLENIQSLAYASLLLLLKSTKNNQKPVVMRSCWFLYAQNLEVCKTVQRTKSEKFYVVARAMSLIPSVILKVRKLKLQEDLQY